LPSYIDKLLENDACIPADRRSLLQPAATEIRRLLADSGSVDLVFVCTHNSRRSQFAQIWAALAAEHFQLPAIRSHSCGTEVTACNPRTAAALERAGLAISRAGNLTNPDYAIPIGPTRPPMTLFSKAFQHASLPKSGFIALMCCDDADRNCPSIPGAIRRISLSYVDPKISDDSPAEAKVYDERCLQIATEMFALMNMVAGDRS